MTAIRLLCALALLALPATAAPKTITLIHVNDTHSHVDAFGPKDENLDGTIGGLWKAASVIASLRASEPNTLLVHGGDLFHGDLFFQMYVGVAEMTLLKELGLDAMALGNHEFEWGPAALFLAASNVWTDPARSPLLSANLDFSSCALDPAACMLQSWVRPASMRVIDGINVGFFALTTPYDPIEQPAPLVIRQDLGETAYLTAAALRAAGAQVVVLVSHLGLSIDRQLAASGADIDVIIGAHDHAATPAPEIVPRPIGGVAVLAEAGSYYRYVGKLTLQVDGTSVQLVDGGLIPIDASVPRFEPFAPAMEMFEGLMVLQYGDVFHTALATAAAPFPNSWDPARKARDTAAGNLVTDLYRAHTGTEIAGEAMGLQDAELPAGPIVGADVFRLMPYGYDPDTRLGFRLATARITGENLMTALELGVSMVLGNDAFLQLSGVRFEYDSCKPPFQRIDPAGVHVNGHRLELDREYTMTMNEGMVQLIGMMPGFGLPEIVLTDVQVLPSPDNLVYIVLRDGIAARGTLEPVVQNRIRDASWRGCD